VPKDTTAAFEVLGELPPTKLAAITVYGDNIYWVENVALGQLMSCPKSGCAGTPTTLMTGLNKPTAMAFDESSLYVLEPPVSTEPQSATPPSVVPITVTQTGRILKCPLTGCDNPQVIYTSTTEAKMENLVVDDRFVYFSGNYCAEDNLTFSYPGWSDGCSFIAAIPK
jgi:hypothetical protein